MAFPDQFSTARLSAERLLPEHVAEIHRMHRDPATMALLGGVRDELQTAAYMTRNLDHWTRYGFGLWLLRDVALGRFVGRALLRHLEVEGVDEIEVGYSLDPSHWGQGLAAEAAAACLEHGRARLKLASVVALTLPENHRSQRVMIKVGMRFERDVQHDGQKHVLFRALL